MLPRLVDERRSKEVRRIEVAHGEAVEPTFLAAAPALDPNAYAIPVTELDSVGTALTKQENATPGECRSDGE